MEMIDVVIQDPNIHGGEPIFRGTRVPFKVLICTIVRPIRSWQWRWHGRNWIHMHYRMPMTSFSPNQFFQTSRTGKGRWP